MKKKQQTDSVDFFGKRFLKLTRISNTGQSVP